MTSGTKILATPQSIARVDYTFNCAVGQTTIGGTEPIGTSLTKTWSGGDDVSTRPVFRWERYTVRGMRKETTHFERFYSRKAKKWVLKRRFKLIPYEKIVRVKIRVSDGTPHRYRPDHPYSCTISGWQSSQFTMTTIGTCNSGWPSFTPYKVVTRRLQASSRNNFGSMVSFDGWLWNGNDDLNLIGKLREKVAGSDFNLGVFLGEGHEALKMITSAATTLYRAVRALRKGDLVGAAAVMKMTRGTASAYKMKKKDPIGSRWLELQYGWMPLLQDIHGGAEFLAHHLNVPYAVSYRVRRKVGGKYTVSPLAQAVDVKCYTSCQIIARIEEVDVPTLSGLLNPLSVAWELVPFSFLADWVLPVGNYLDARGLASALTGTFVTTRKNYFASSVGGHQPSVDTTYSNVLIRDLNLTISRTVSTTLNVPLPNVKTFGQVTSWKHAANALALLSTSVVGQRIRDRGE